MVPDYNLAQSVLSEQKFGFMPVGGDGSEAAELWPGWADQ